MSYLLYERLTNRHAVKTEKIGISSSREGHLVDTAFFEIVNPFSKEHGAPSDSNRHVGDLGNIKTDAQGNAKGSIEDNMIKLIGESSVLGVRSSSSTGAILLHVHYVNQTFICGSTQASDPPIPVPAPASR